LTLTGSYTPSGGTGVTYNWYKPGNSVAVQSGSSNIFNYSPSLNISDSGDYGLIVVRNGCTSSQTTVTITVRNTPSPQVYRIANR
jgi:hypothetical protein